MYFFSLRSVSRIREVFIIELYVVSGYTLEFFIFCGSSIMSSFGCTETHTVTEIYIVVCLIDTFFKITIEYEFLLIFEEEILSVIVLLLFCSVSEPLS